MAAKHKYSYALRYRFTGNMSELEDWVLRNSRGGFTYHLADVHETGTPFGQLDIMFYFEYKEDRTRFKQRARAQPPW